MPLQATSGAASYDGFGGGVAAVPNYIEDVFSTYLYTGNSSTQTITNGIDLAGKGGMTWFKNRTYGYDNCLFDTTRGSNKLLISNSTAAQASPTNMLNSFNSNGFTLGDDGYTGGAVNASGSNYASWTFRKQPKFFDVVTYTGTGASSQTISHSLASVPGFIAIKRTDSTGDWVVIARSSSNGQYYCLQNATTPFGFNSTNAAFGTVDFAGMGYLSSTTFLPYVFGGGNSSTSGTNISGATYVAYLFAHNAGGFGLTGTDNVISCGSYTGTGTTSGPTINLGYEPQWVLIKRASGGAGDWIILDTMRGITKDTWYTSKYLYPNLSSSEVTTDGINILSTGFQIANSNSYINGGGSNYIYIAIRRGPMKVPTDATKVFSPLIWTGNNTTNVHTTGFPVDMTIVQNRQGTGANPQLFDRLRGMVASTTTASAVALFPNTTDAETGAIYSAASDSNTAWISYSGNSGNASGVTYADWAFQRAPSFFDEVCYTGTGVARTVTHNLGVAPEMYIIKRRDGTGTNWVIYSAYLATPNDKNLYFTTAGESTNANIWSTPTSTTFGIGTGLPSAAALNASGGIYVAYLFATCAGVSKVGSYTGNGSTQTINCGFTSGARFVLIKRTDSTGDWYVWDTARGIVTANDPHLSLNTTAAEVTTDDTIDPDSTGFIVNQVTATNVNVSSATYIYLAIA